MKVSVTSARCIIYEKDVYSQYVGFTQRQVVRSVTYARSFSGAR